MATQQTKDGLGYIIQAISNIVEPKMETLKYDKTYRAKVTQKIDAGVYNVQINGTSYKLSYSGALNVGDIVRVKAPLNNFSDIYIEPNITQMGAVNINVAPSMNGSNWVKVCNISFKNHVQGEFVALKFYIGNGNNSNTNQNAYIDLIMQLGWTGSKDGRLGCNAILNPISTGFTISNTSIKVIYNNRKSYDVWFYTSSTTYCRVNYIAEASSNAIITPKWSFSSSAPTGTACDLEYKSIKDS